MPGRVQGGVGASCFGPLDCQVAQLEQLLHPLFGSMIERPAAARCRVEVVLHSLCKGHGCIQLLPETIHVMLVVALFMAQASQLDNEVHLQKPSACCQVELELDRQLALLSASGRIAVRLLQEHQILKLQLQLHQLQCSRIEALCSLYCGC